MAGAPAQGAEGAVDARGQATPVVHHELVEEETEEEEDDGEDGEDNNGREQVGGAVVRAPRDGSTVAT